MLSRNNVLRTFQRKKANDGSSVPLQHRLTGSDKRYFWLGVFLLTALLLQQLTARRWVWLAELQAGNIYLQFSGFVLLGLIIYQWRFAFLRVRGDTERAAALLRRHKLFGAMAPLLFFGHAQSLGYAYLEVLSLTFLLVFLTGLYNFEITKIHKGWLMSLWILLHVGSAMTLLFLLTYHIYISYAFK